MDKARVATWILSTVVAPGQARSAVGDWLEDSGMRGNIWFWKCVSRTVVAHIWTGLAESPRSIAILGLRAWVYSLWITAGFFFLAFLILLPFFGLAAWLLPGKNPLPEPLFSLFGWGLSAACTFQVGKWLARRAPGREVAACISFTLMETLATSIVVLVIMRIRGSAIEHTAASQQTSASSAAYFLGMNCVCSAILLAGALRVRRKSLQSTSA